MIELNETLQAMDTAGSRLTTPPNARQDNPSLKHPFNITDLVNTFRGALCHLQSGNKKWKDNPAGMVSTGWMILHHSSHGGTVEIGGILMPDVPEGDYMVRIGEYGMLMGADFCPALEAAISWIKKTYPTAGHGMIGSEYRMPVDRGET